MRIVAGERKGARLAAPPGRATRPTSDRVRESLFAILADMLFARLELRLRRVEDATGRRNDGLFDRQ